MSDAPQRLIVTPEMMQRIADIASETADALIHRMRGEFADGEGQVVYELVLAIMLGKVLAKVPHPELTADAIAQVWSLIEGGVPFSIEAKRVQ
jgi:hypothetical protein